MTAIWYAISDLIQFFFPLLKAIGGYYNAFWILLIFIGCCGWVKYMANHLDPIEKFD